MIKRIYKDIERMRKHFGWDKTDTKAFLVNACLEEAHELKDALNEDEASFKSELADVLTYALAICMDEGYDVEEIIHQKIEEVMKREY
ncbi:MAG TPA: MazG nucleotide pyrophosphohydrolase domain-containing protein [Erysipelothrix sp.]|nr:MazG nucleotide pyrophosphohydrolase domain-containing protein [Erysipelothrix sp.]